MTARCDDVRAAAAELALDSLTGPERAEALDHLAGCAACRREVESAARVADGLLHLAPAVDPGPAAEAAVLARMARERGDAVVPLHRRRALVPAAVAAAVAAVLAVTGTLLVAGGAGDGARTAELVGSTGAVTGELVIFDDDRMVCVFDDTRAGAAWSVEVVGGGRVHEVGRFEAPGGEWAWTVRLPIDGDDVEEVVVRTGTGEVLATATL